jgi:hypothetical protein
MSKIPSFVTFINLPKEFQIINSGDDFTIKGDKNNKTFTKMSEAYDYVNEVLKGNPIFNSDIIPTEGSEVHYGFYEEPVDNGVRLLLSHSHQDTLYNLEYQYKYAIKCEKRFNKKPTFYNAYEFLIHHPMSWSRNQKHPNFWRTDSGLDDMWTSVLRVKNEKGKLETVILLEHGPYLDSELKGKHNSKNNSSHNFRLDATAKTYEKAIIKLAKRVHKFYNIDGSDKVPLEEPSSV